MLFKIQKAFESLNHPGIDTSLLKLGYNAIPYYFNNNYKAHNPLTLYWSINSVCNLRCKMCDVGTFNEESTFFKTLRIDRKLHEIDINVFKSVIDEVKHYKPFISLNSTEPLMYKQISNAISYCSSSNLKSAITTGAYFLENVAKDLAESKLTRLNVSIDGPSNIHNSIRGKKDVFEKAVEGIRLFKLYSDQINHKPEIIINYTITNLNYFCLNDFLKSIKDVPYTRVNFCLMWFLSPEIVDSHNSIWGNKYDIQTSCYDDHVSPNKVDVDLLYRQIKKIEKNKKIHFLFKKNLKWLKNFFYDSLNPISTNANCMASWFFTQILADGNVIVYSRCHNKSVGNINNEKLLNIWNNDKMREWRKFIKQHKKMPMCSRCDLVY